MADGPFRSAAHSLVALGVPNVHRTAMLPDLYTDCLRHLAALEPFDRTPYLELVLRHLVHDAPSLSDEALASLMSALHRPLRQVPHT